MSKTHFTYPQGAFIDRFELCEPLNVIKRAWAEIERIAADERYKDAHKAEQIRDLAARAIAEAEIAAQQEITELELRAADLAQRARQQLLAARLDNGKVRSLPRLSL